MDKLILFVGVTIFSIFAMRNFTNVYYHTTYSPYNKDRQLVASTTNSSFIREFRGDLSAFIIMRSSNLLKDLNKINKSLVLKGKEDHSYFLNVKESFVSRFVDVFQVTDKIYKSFAYVSFEAAYEYSSCPFKNFLEFLDFAISCKFIESDLIQEFVYRKNQFEDLMDEI